MHSPAPNIPGATSAVSPFNEYMDKLKATSIDDICELDETPTLYLYTRMPQLMPLALVVAEHWQVAWQCSRKEAISRRLKQ